jgi:mannosyltransferase
MVNKIFLYLKSQWALLGIVLLGLLLRLWNLTAISLWHDEAFSALLIKYSWSEMMYRIGLDVHPPMYYIFLRIWHYIFGDSLFALRAMSVLFGVGTIIATYYFVNYVFKNKRTALIAALLIAVNPFQVQYVTEARMYTMGAFFAVCAALTLSAALRNQTQFYAAKTNKVLQRKLKKSFLIYYALFVVCSSILIYTHYYLLFTVAALGLYAILYCAIHFRLQFKKYIWVIISGLLILISFLPWLKTFMFQYKQVGAGYWIPPMDAWSIPGTLWDLLFQFYNREHWILIVLTLLVIWMIWQLIRKYSETEKWLVLAGFLAPFGGAMLFFLLAKLQHNNSSVYLVRYFIFCSSFYIIIISLFLEKIKIKPIATLLLIALVGVNLYSIWFYWQDLHVADRRGMAAASEFLNANVEPQHKIYVGSSFEFFNYKYYNHTAVKPLLFTNGASVKDLPHFAGTAILTDDDLIKNFSEGVQSGDVVWVIWTNGFGGSKPNTPSSWSQIDEKGFAEIRPYVGTWIIVTEYKVH